jgi:hypothetical protein
MSRLSALSVRAFSVGALLLANAAALPAWGQAVVAPAMSSSGVNAPAGAASVGPGRVRLDMPLVSPEAAKAYFAARTVPKSNVPPLVGEAHELDARVLAAPVVVAHPLPTEATSPFGRARADFAHPAVQPSAVVQQHPLHVFHHGGPSRKRTMNEADPAAPVTKLGLAIPDGATGAGTTTPGASKTEAPSRLASAGQAVLSGLSSALVTPASAQTLSCTPPPDEPEIVALARALQYKYSLIYDYVYYNIDYSPTWGSKKGALGTYLDRRGNNIDQNVLFVALLRQSCITANFRYGGIAYNADEIANLLGVQNDQVILSHALGDGGGSSAQYRRVDGGDHQRLDQRGRSVVEVPHHLSGDQSGVGHGLYAERVSVGRAVRVIECQRGAHRREFDPGCEPRGHHLAAQHLFSKSAKLYSKQPGIEHDDAGARRQGDQQQ